MYNKILLVHPNTPDYKTIQLSIKQDVSFVLLGQVDESGNDIIYNLQSLTSNKTHIALIWNNQWESHEIPFENFESILRDDVTIDLVTCNLNSDEFINRIAQYQNQYSNLLIRYSIDKTGNPDKGGDWIMESNNDNIKDVYFSESINEYKYTLDVITEITSSILVSNKPEYFSYDNGSSTITMLQDIDWKSEIVNDLSFSDTAYIALTHDETFNGDNYVVDLSDIIEWEGLFTTDNTNGSESSRSLIKNVGVINGGLKETCGYIVKEYQKYFKIESCYSTGTIAKFGGGIAGRESGGYGSCVITNCYSTGDINRDSGGMVGQLPGRYGSCVITNCYSTGNIDKHAGGIAGLRAGGLGSCVITNCYTTGTVGAFSGGIVGEYTGQGGICVITNCYSLNGSISGRHTAYNGSCVITNCYSNRNL